MKVILRNLLTNETQYIDYPRYDMGPIINVNPNVRYYLIDYEPFNESYNSFTHYTVLNEEFTETPHNEYPHIFICRRYYTIQQHDDSVIITNLNLSVGDHIEINMPLWKSVKYMQRIYSLKEQKVLSEADQAELLYMESLIDWAKRVRDERDRCELAFTSQGIVPSFEWEEVPTRNSL